LASYEGFELIIEASHTGAVGVKVKVCS